MPNVSDKRVFECIAIQTIYFNHAAKIAHTPRQTGNNI